MLLPKSLVENAARLHGCNDLAGELARDLRETRRIIHQALDALDKYEGPAAALAAVLILNRALPKETK